MKGRLIDFSIGWNGKQRVTIELDSDFREGFDALKDAVVEVTIKKWRQHRSNSANAYFHLLVNEIALSKGGSDEEVKRELIVKYGTLARDDDGNIIGFKLPISVDVDLIYPYTRYHETVEENGKLFNCFLCYKRSSWMDTKEMSHLIDGTIEDAKELGIDTDTPEQKVRWKNLSDR